MDESLLNSMFERSRDRYDGAVRWACIVVFVLLGFHLLMFNHYLDADRKLAAVDAEKAAITKKKEVIDGVIAGLNDVQAEAIDALSVLLKQTFANLRADFGALSERIREIRSGDTVAATPDGDAETPLQGMPDPLQREPPDPGLTDYPFQFQRPDDRSYPRRRRRQLFDQDAMPEPGLGPLPRPISLDESVVAAIRGAEGMGEIRDHLRPLIEAQSIGPRFKALNDGWRLEILPRIEKRVGGLRNSIKQQKPADPADDPYWGAVNAALDRVVEAARRLHFEPPEDPYWWVSTGGKGETLFQLGVSARQELDQSAAVEAIGRELAGILAAQKQLHMELENKLKQLEEVFERQKSQLSIFGYPLSAVPLNLIALLGHFPLLIGIILAVMSIWLMRRFMELVTVTSMMVKRDAESPVRQWLLSRMPGYLRTGKPGAWGVYVLGLTGLAWLWIAAASFELIGWQDIDLQQAALRGVLGGAAIAIALGCLWRMVPKAVQTLSMMNDSAPPC